MGEVEERLKDTILNNYKSIREFSISAGIGQPTMATILKRGLMNANVSNVIKIFNCLNLSIDEFMKGNVVHVEENKKLSIRTETLVQNFNRLDEPDKGKIEERIDTMLEADKYHHKKDESKNA